MHPRLAELTAFLDEQQAALSAAVDAVPATLRTTRPVPDRWSVAEVLEHIVIVERRLTALFQAWLDEARAAGVSRETDDSPVLPGIDTAIVLNRTRKRVAVPAVQPAGTMSVEDSLRAVDQIRQELKAVISAADGIALSQIVKPHPALGSIGMYEWIAFVGGHMGRHALQIREVGEQLAAARGV